VLFASTEKFKTYILVCSLKLLLFRFCKRNVVFIAGSESLTELMSMIVQRVGEDLDRTRLPRLMVRPFVLNPHKSSRVDSKCCEVFS